VVFISVLDIGHRMGSVKTMVFQVTTMNTFSARKIASALHLPTHAPCIGIGVGLAERNQTEADENESTRTEEIHWRKTLGNILHHVNFEACLKNLL
jgi:hypothetical protein